MNDAETISELTLKSAEPVVVDHDGRTFLVTPEGAQALDITDPQNKPAPTRVIQGVTLQTADSLVDYVDRFGGPNTVLFADIAASSITAQIDYHAAAAEGHVEPDFIGHRATLTLPFSEEWATWKAVDGKLLEQLEFARFVEENASDVAAPSGADLLEIARDLQAVRKVNFTKAVRTATDNENFTYSDETNVTKGGVDVPTRFLLDIPVYFGEAATSIYAFLRWRLEDGNLKLGVKLSQPERVRQAVFKQIVLEAGSRTSKPVVFGKI